MESKPIEAGTDQVIDELRACASTLVEKLKNDDYQQANEVIARLTQTRDSLIFNSVGRLTRALHSAIVNFNVDAEESADARLSEKSHISDASDRLQYVLKVTQDAADRTMDKVEASAPIASDISQESLELRKEWSRLKRREMGADEFRQLYYRMDEFLERIGGGAEQLSQNLQEIILEQGYQDLTGQVLKKVIGLVSDVESELVNLVRIAGQVEDIAGFPSAADNSAKQPLKANATGEGPQIHAEKRADVVSSQDEVDDLLSSLGF
ncbi:protein phosphatase CheZ [Halioxenophilus sp. WMMB6]|uniref:protein phosphatase CheZ n=1 Tax=Halioxenophilus sp. WMMB6 TaxID=3073815 RepID=UPI00295EA94E|nr:protein phosphatase CheZ [Halioxenophilus sp. WMMB6]